MSDTLPDGEHDLVWWLRFGRMHEAADEIERLRARVALEIEEPDAWWQIIQFVTSQPEWDEEIAEGPGDIVEYVTEGLGNRRWLLGEYHRHVAQIDALTARVAQLEACLTDVKEQQIGERE